MSKPVFPGERVRLAINKLPDLLQNYLGRNSASRQPFSVRKTVSLLEGLEADHQQSPDCSTRLCLAFCGSTPSVQQTSRDSSSCHFFKSWSTLDGNQVPPEQWSIGDLLPGEGVWDVYYSHISLLRKRQVGFLNACLLIEKFRMKTLAPILWDLKSSMWKVSLDLKDSYLHVQIFLHTGSSWGSHWGMLEDLSAFVSGESFHLGWQQPADSLPRS